jgi:hypothetical protein
MNPRVAGLLLALMGLVATALVLMDRGDLPTALAAGVLLFLGAITLWRSRRL